MYDFDKIIDRSGTDTFKFELREKIFNKADVIPLWVADMDFAAPPAVVEAVKKRADHPVYGYTVRPESFNLSIQNWLKNRHGWNVGTDKITFTPGVVPALALSILAFSGSGDGIIIQPPVYPPFHSIVTDNDRKLVYNPLILEEGKYRIDFDGLEALASQPENKILILSSPHNPVGRLWSKEELTMLGDICLKHNVLVLSDEIHSDLALYGNKHIPFASIKKEFADNCLTFMAPSKTFNIAGFATSYVVCENDELRKGFRSIINSLHLYTGTIFSGVILEAAYNHGAEWLDALLKYIEGNIDLVYDFVKAELPQVSLVKPDATYLLWLDFRKTGWDQDRLNSFLINEANVGLNDGTLFGKDAGKGFMRMNVGSSRLVIQKALDNVKRAFERI